MNEFCYLGDRPNFCGGCEVAVTARVRIGWVRFRECEELLLGNRFPLRMKGKVYHCCIRSAISVWKPGSVSKENEKAILRRTLALKETIDQLATANEVRWYGHVLRRDDNSVLRVVLDLEVSGNRKTTIEDLEEASVGGDKEDWFEKRNALN